MFSFGWLVGAWSGVMVVSVFVFVFVFGYREYFNINTLLKVEVAPLLGSVGYALEAYRTLDRHS